ncbi:hypothetical protein [Pseudarthrobacter sp. MDT3-1]
MEIIGKIQIADGSISHITAHSEGYEPAKASLPESAKQIAIPEES